MGGLNSDNTARKRVSELEDKFKSTQNVALRAAFEVRENMKKLRHEEQKVQQKYQKFQRKREERQKQYMKKKHWWRIDQHRMQNLLVNRNTTEFLRRINKKFTPKHIVVILQNNKDKSRKS